MKKLIAVLAVTFLFTHSIVLQAEEVKSLNDVAATVPDGMVFRKRLEDARKILHSNGKKLDANVTLESAKELLDQNIQEDPTHAQTYMELATYYILKNEVKQAEGSLNQAIRIMPEFHEAQFLRAQLHYKAGEIAEARVIKNIGLVTVKDNLTFNATIELLKLLTQFKDKENILSYSELALTKAISDSEKSLAHSALGGYYANLQDYPKCVEHKEKAVFFDMENAVENRELADCYYRIKKYELAYRSAERSLAIIESDEAKAVLLVAIDGNVKEFIKEGRYVNVEEFLLKSIKVYNKNLKVHLELIKAQIKLSKFDEAIKSTKAAIELDRTKLPEIVSYISRVYKKKIPEFSEFMDKFLAELKEPALVGETAYNIANSLELLDEKPEAVKWIGKGKSMMNQPGQSREPASVNVDDIILKANLSLLALKIDNNKLVELEEANNYFKEARKKEHDNVKVVAMEENLNQVNTKFGRSPSSVIWKAKLFLSKYMPVSWMNF